MAWVQVGPHKINTAQICYLEQKGDSVRLYFHGVWEGNPLDLHNEHAIAFWKHMKAEDVFQARDKGSSTVMPRMRSAVTLEVDVNQRAAEKAKVLPAAQVPQSPQPGRPARQP